MADTTMTVQTAAEIQSRPTASLKPHARNARTHSRKQIRQIADSIATFGFTNPVLIDADGGILAGHGRVEAAKLLGLAEVPCLRIDWMTDQERRAFVLADNKLALNAGWDEELLALELGALIEEVPELDIRLTGFTIAEVDEILDLGGTDATTESAEDDALPPVPEGPALTRPGDVWRLGPHRLLCGDALEDDSYTCLLDAPAQMIFTDPPYNVPIQGHVTGKGRRRHREFAMASGEMSREEFTGFLTTVFTRLAAHSIDGSIHFVCMDWRHMPEILAAGEASYTELKNLCVWTKGQGGMGSFYRSRHELVFVFKAGTAPHVNSFELGQHGRNRTNVWSYPGISSGTRTARAEQALHPTVKPVAMVADAMRDCSTPGGLVLDVFGGSGTTLIAAEKTRRRARLIELDPLYCDRAIERWQRFAHDDAYHEATGLTPMIFGSGARRPAMAKYEVGYGKPPKSGQFRKGQSGNPKGRPKKHRTLAEDVRRVANETVTLRTEDGTRRVSKRTALVRRIMNDALKGDKQASRDMVRLILAADDAATLEAATQDVRADLGEEDQAILERWVKRIGKDAAAEG